MRRKGSPQTGQFGEPCRHRISTAPRNAVPTRRRCPRPGPGQMVMHGLRTSAEAFFAVAGPTGRTWVAKYPRRRESRIDAAHHARTLERSPTWCASRVASTSAPRDSVLSAGRADADRGAGDARPEQNDLPISDCALARLSEVLKARDVRFRGLRLHHERILGESAPSRVGPSARSGSRDVDFLALAGVTG